MHMLKKLLISSIIGVLFLGCANMKISPLPEIEEKFTKAEEGETNPDLVYRFFDEDYVSGGYAYWYPDESRVYIPEESGKNGEVALQFDLIANEFSGGSVCLYNLLYDVQPYYRTGGLQFWIKGSEGGEIAWVALVDDENSDGVKTVVRLPLNNYGGIKKEWTKVTIPLADFGKRGVYWDAKKRVEVPEYFQWDKVGEFRIEIKKADNKNFRVWVDDIFVVKDQFEPAQEVEEEYWDEIEEEITPPPVSERPNVERVHTIFDGAMPPGGFAYVYGGKTAYVIQPTTGSGNVLAMYQDNTEYSGVTLALGNGNSIDLTEERKTSAGLAFWAKAGPNITKVGVGLLDDESDGKKVQTKRDLGDFGQIDTTWKYFMIPIKQFAPQGNYWDEQKKAEVLGDVRWDQINEVRFSINRFENKIPDDEPVNIYVDEITIIEDIPGYVDPEEFWAAFDSDEPEVLLHDFEDKVDHNWEASGGPKSTVSYDIVAVDDEDEKYGENAMKIDFKLRDWCDVVYNYQNNNAPKQKRDWSKHWGLRFSFYTERAYQAVTVQIADAGNELFVQNVGGRRGWNEILVPFKGFNKFPYYQPPDAELNGHFDLENVVSIDFKPSGEGTQGSFKVDNIKLTNEREIESQEVPEQVAVKVNGSFDETITERINDGIFGINVALWDGDLLKPETEEYVKAVNHGVLRYPGGLRADDDHWQEVLDAKDWMVDTDEFWEFCQKTNTTAMITVNFGRGTPEEAAAWVEHMNIKHKADIKYWEVGNELYGDWHNNHCTAEEYGKRAAEFIKAMKAVDPTIKVTVVWVLEGDWNREVFEYTKDLADGVIVHHYPQHYGQENDLALLSAPQTLDEILPGVREQIEKWGNPERDYEIWLTEWNSVDFNPGPQTLQPVNGLFVIDYLGVLTRHNIEQASYWDVHNSVTPEGGDYGYLSRTGAPDGDNVPRPSYWAFRLASKSLRGRLVKSESSNEDVTTYMTEKENGDKTLLIVNKQKKTKANVTIDIPGFEGNAIIEKYEPETSRDGLPQENIAVKKGTTVTIPGYSAWGITIPAN